MHQGERIKDRSSPAPGMNPHTCSLPAFPPFPTNPAPLPLKVRPPRRLCLGQRHDKEEREGILWQRGPGGKERPLLLWAMARHQQALLWDLEAQASCHRWAPREGSSLVPECWEGKTTDGRGQVETIP